MTTKKNDVGWVPKEGDILDFLDGKESRRSVGTMKVVEVVRGLARARGIIYEASASFPEETLFDMWRRTVGDDMRMFGSDGYRIFDWGCDTFVVCEPKDEPGMEVAFAATSDGGWYTLADDKYNGRLAKGPDVSGLHSAHMEKEFERSRRMTENEKRFYTAVYMDTDGRIKEKRFDSLESSRKFFKTLAEAGVPTVVPEGPRKNRKTRIEEIDELLSEFYSKASSGLAENAVRNVVALELEKAYWKKT